MIDYDTLLNGSGVKLLGFFEGVPKPPAPTRCQKGMKCFDRFFFIKRGTMTFELDGAVLSAGAGDILYLPRDCSYFSRWDTPDGFYITVNFVMRGDPDSPPLGDRIEIAGKDRSGKYQTLFETAAKEWGRGEIGHGFACMASFFRIVTNLYSDSLTESVRVEYDNIYPAMLYLKNNYQTDVTTSDLAKLCRMSGTAFRREFKKRCGMPPVALKNKLRMEKARELLRGGERDVSETGRLVGLDDVCYFSKLYKKTFGVPPSKDIN